MPHDEDVTRRVFLERLGAGAILGATGACNRPVLAQSNGSGWTPPPVLKNPNILIIMVDQLRLPCWLNTTQQASLPALLPNMVGLIQNNSYNFGQYFVAATVCTPSRGTLLTGLYAPQTVMTQAADGAAGEPNLNPAFPTWGEALTVLNPAYSGNVWWFGKWHLSAPSKPLGQYGFNTRTYPSSSTGNPIGFANEGADGGPYAGKVYPSDAEIAGDFIGWLQGQPPTTAPSSPWCATVSLINPHDIAWAPDWLQSSPFPPTGVPVTPPYFPPLAGSPPPFYPALPSPWNYENLSQKPNKPTLQHSFLYLLNQNFGTVTNWLTFLNQYFWLQTLVDLQVGNVLNALQSSPFANNTIIIFTSDHGEYGGSHGIHDKGFAVYDESLRVPFCVQFPGQSGMIPMNQMCSAVDLFGLICDLGTGGSGQWRLAYPDLANRQSIWSFLSNNSSETRVAPSPVGLPYILHTFDMVSQSTSPPTTLQKSHIVCMRTKLDLNQGAIGAKLAFYSAWADCTNYPNATPPDVEFYDYNPSAANNTAEVGNDYYSNNAATQNTLEQHTQVLGSAGPPGTGIIANELNRPLIGTDAKGNPLSQAQATALQAYYTYADGAGSCS